MEQGLVFQRIVTPQKCGAHPPPPISVNCVSLVVNNATARQGANKVSTCVADNKCLSPPCGDKSPAGQVYGVAVNWVPAFAGMTAL